jgi:hypothetical protein
VADRGVTREEIVNRLAELEAQRNANYWRCHMQGSMNGYRPLPRSFFEERQKLEQMLKDHDRNATEAT